ncbi:dolichol kinase [Halobacteriales archaeon QS_8_69_26]|nr:MAG: dolichol kinase [Halobacteriales archaeon QS_8_69_26]
MRDEIARRLVHFSGTAVPAAYLLEVLPWRVIRWVLAVGAVGAVVLEAVRLLVGLDWYVFEKLTREYERNNPAGYALAVIAMAVVAWAFAPTVAVPALLMLTVADPFAGLMADAGGPESTKEWWVVGATFLLCLGIGLPFLPPRAAVPAALVATLADATTPRVASYVIDDNFSIPVGAAITAFLAATYVPVILCESACRIA